MFFLKENFSPVELAWVAGFLEADGSFVIRRTKNKDGSIYELPFVNAHNTDLKPLEHLKELFGGYIYYNGDKRPNRKRGYIWRVAGKNARAVVRKILPFIKGDKKKRLTSNPNTWQLFRAE